MITLGAICILYTLIHWGYLIKTNNLDYLDDIRSFPQVLLLCTTVISCVIIGVLIVNYLP